MNRIVNKPEPGAGSGLKGASDAGRRHRLPFIKEAGKDGVPKKESCFGEICDGRYYAEAAGYLDNGPAKIAASVLRKSAEAYGSYHRLAKKALDLEHAEDGSGSEAKLLEMQKRMTLLSAVLNKKLEKEAEAIKEKGKKEGDAEFDSLLMLKHHSYNLIQLQEGSIYLVGTLKRNDDNNKIPEHLEMLNGFIRLLEDLGRHPERMEELFNLETDFTNRA
ncbi:MAG: hypothetical protein V1728_02730 [Candidatus Micrarchaeota archaeon]